MTRRDSTHGDPVYSAPSAADDGRSVSGTRRGLLRTIGAAAVAGTTGVGRVGAQDEESPTPPTDVEVVNALDTSIQLDWADHPSADAYEWTVDDGEDDGAIFESEVRIDRLEPDTTYSIDVRAIVDGVESPPAPLTVTTAPSYEEYPVSVSTRLDHDRTDAEGNPGLVVELSDLPEDGAIERYRIRVSDALGRTDVFSSADRPTLEEGTDGPLTITHSETEDLNGAWLVEGTATDEPPGAADEPIELATVFHREISEETDDGLPVDVEVETLVGVEGVGREGVDPWDVLEQGVEQWTIDTWDAAEEDVAAEPEVSDDGVEVVVSGAATFHRSGCDTFYPRTVAFDEELERVGVVVDEVARHERYPDVEPPDECTEAVQHLGYELTIVPEGSPDSVVVDEAFTDADRSVHYVSGEPGPDVDRVVAEHDLVVEEGGTSEDAQSAPDVAFDGDRLLVEGTIAGGSGSCASVGVGHLEFSDPVNHDFEVRVANVPAEDLLPGDACPAVVEYYDYTLEVTFEDVPPHVTVVENDTPRATATHPEAGLELRNVESYEWDASVDLSIVDEEQSVAFDGDVVTISGLARFANTGCVGLAPEYLAFDEERSAVGVVLSSVDTGGGCYHAVSIHDYELTVQLPAEAETVVVESDVSPAHNGVYYADGDPSLEPPAGVADYELTVGSPGDDGPDEPQVTFRDGAVLVEGYTEIGSSSCGTLELDRLEWVDDREHLAVDVVQTVRDDHLPLDGCTEDVASAPYELVVEFEDGGPGAVTVAEQGEEKLTAEREGLVLPEGVLDYEVATEFTQDPDGVGDDPEIDADSSAEPPQIFVDGTLSVGPCSSLELTDVRWADEAASHLAVRVESVSQLPEGEDCELAEPASPTEYEVTLDVDSIPATVTAEEETAAGGEPVRTSTATFADGCARSEAVDGQTVCDVNDDGYYRDLTGDGSVGQGDVAEFFGKQHRDAWKRPELFDFSGNGAVTHGDVVELADYVALQ